MVNLTRASRELFSRTPDEQFETLAELHQHCLDQKNRAVRIKEPAATFIPTVRDEKLALKIDGRPAYELTDWSFSQLCGFARVAKDTVNRLHPSTAADVLSQTLVFDDEDETEFQALVLDDRVVRALNGGQYKRLWNADLTAMLLEYAVDFTPPQKGFNGATGLYAGEQDLFCFMIDPTGWAEIGGEAFAPGFFVWNSEVGRRSVGLTTFWFQKVCCNHIVWDATEIVEITRRHTGRVRDALTEIRQEISELVARRDQRRDGFARVIAKAMNTTYGQDAEEVQKLLTKAGIGRALAERAIKWAPDYGGFTIWGVVNALTRLTSEARFAGNRVEADQKAASLLQLVAA
ncbi:MAG: DUF932 domain-containing protein [Planctomycetia bacterium]|nr:DUF932 domain-containing protein [Planctomycetia bacterium]